MTTRRSLMKPLTDEHAELRPRLEDIRRAAATLDRSAVAAVHRFVGEHLVPHARAEDEVLYPIVDRVAGAGTSDTMRRDHVTIAALIDELGELVDGGAEEDLRRVLYGLYAVLELHFAKEDAIYVPLLERHLTQSEADSMFADMAAAAAKVRAASAL